MIMTDLQNEFGMVLVEANKKVSAKTLNFNRNYQRATEHSRKEKVKKSMLSCGQFLSEKSLTVNQDDEVVDGQHRLLAALEIDWESVPITKYYFTDPQSEAAFFSHINGFDERLGAKDYWYSKYLSGDPIATFIYNLDENYHTALKDKIRLKGKDTKDSKLSIGQVLECLAIGIGYNTSNWEKTRHDKWVKQFNKFTESALLIVIDDFISWYEQIFGTKKENPIAYRQDSFRAIKFFYLALKKKGLHNKKTTIYKMKTFNLDVAFVTAPLHGKNYQLINHFNKGRRKETIPYNIE